MMEYNTRRKKLPLPEYGRGIQNMVDYALTLEDREERQRCANTIVSIMGNMFPHLRDVSDFNHKLWDHLAAMSNYQLDIDYPYEITPEATLHAKPKPMAYSMKRIRYRHYGYLLESLLKKLKDMEDGPERDALIRLVANQMKQSLYNWNKDGMDEEKVADDIAYYTDGKVQLDLEKFHFASVQTRSLSGGAAMGMRVQRKNNRKRN